MKSSPVAKRNETSSPGLGALSSAQQRIWLLEQLHPGNPAHNVSRALRLTGMIDREKFERAWQEVSRQHEILRIEFNSSDGVPEPCLCVSSSALLGGVAIEGISPEDLETKLSQLARSEARRAFDLSRGPLVRAFLWQVAPLEHVFLLVAHRMISDERSLDVLLGELASRYETYRRGETQEPAEELEQYGEFVSRGGRVSQQLITYWQQQLAGIAPSIDLPTDRLRPALQTFRGATHAFSIEKSLLEQLRAVGTAHNTDLFVTLLAGFDVLLSRYSRQEDIVVGTPAPGRRRPELENLVGPLDNIVVLRADLSGSPTFSELLTRVRNATEEAFSNQDMRFEILLELLQVERDLSRHPLFQVAFRLQKAFVDGRWASGISCTSFEVDIQTESFDLSLDLMEGTDVVKARLGYNADLFEADTIIRIAQHYKTLLTDLIADPARQISQVSLLPEAERRKVLFEFNATATDYRSDLCVQDFFEEQTERTPQATALICESERLTYGELNARANHVAHYLRRQGVGPEVLVGICVERSVDMLVGILGILKAGGAYLPLDPAYPRARLAAILEDAKAPILLTQQRLTGILLPNGAQMIRLDADWADLAAEPATNPTRNVKANNLDYVLFTSGSTGRPKGVALEHRSAAVFIQWACDVFLPEEIAGTLFSTSMCFDLSVFEMFVPLSMGGKVIVAPNALALPKLPAAGEVTLINTVPSAIAELVQMGGLPASLRVVNLAGEALPTGLAKQIYEKTKVKKVYNLYGPTEDTTYSTYTLVPRNGEVTIGRPLPNTQVYILDGNRQPVPIGVPGELHLAGDGLARGYYGRKDLTAERFVPNPFAGQPGARMYRTGDLARFLTDGNIQYLGRIDNQVKVRGFRIELGEIESVLAQHPAVQSVVVIAREDIPGDKRLVAYVVPSGGHVSSGPLKDLLKQRLPEYMIPSAFVEMSALPLSPNGKINRRLLPAPDWSATDRADALPPRDGLESTLVKIWQKVLGIPNIGVRDNFFDLGGHSLMATRLLREVERAIGKEIPLSALFRGATVESLAQLIRQPQSPSDPVAMEIQHGEGTTLPFFAIVPPGEESLGYAMLARHMGPGQSVFKIQGHAPLVGDRPYTEQEMQALADEYIAAMRTVQPEGPYCLGGLCDGTHIAERVVISLESQGEVVGLFAIFDTWVLQHSQRPWLWHLHYLGQRLQQMNRQPLRDRLKSYKRAAASKIRGLLEKKSVRPDWQQAYWPKNFAPVRFRAPVILFKRPKQPFYYVNDPQMGWGQRTESEVEIHEFDFSHLETLREPHVRIFGEKLAECLGRVTRRTANLAALTKNAEPALSTASVQQLRQGP